VAAQIAYPLADGELLRRITIAVVVLFAAACVTHAAITRGTWWAVRFVVVSAGGGLVAEAVGVRTGVPFGDYAYAGTLGPELLDVPLVVPLAWTMMAYPVLLAARRLTRRAVAVVGGLGLTAWDVFLDPQMVDDGHWRWADPTPALPGVEGIPLTNYLGWLLVGTAMMFVLDRVLPRRRSADETLPALLLGWTWVGYVIGNAFWFGTVSVAIVGGVLMGALVVPYLWTLWRGRR
jgi:putative membrane protein